jgi:uncharacterized membrane protein YeaQ/YmgE (transglycosylase-associated protein family)
MLAALSVFLFQERVVVFSWQRGLLSWIFLGLIAGWLAGKIARGRGYGCLTDTLLGLVGSVVGGWLFTKLNIVHENTFLFSLAAATVGALILVTIVHLLVGDRP